MNMINTVNPIIKRKGGQLFTTSLDVAEKFGKRHDHVLASIRKIVNDNASFGLPNFRESSYRNEQNRKQPMFEMTRSGFSILAMGFTGKKALGWKIKYEQAFSSMEQALANQKNLLWQEERHQGKVAREEVTDAIKTFVAYAEGQGSKNARHYYVHITRATYRFLFIIGEHSGQSFRDLLDTMQLSFLQTAEYAAAQAIVDGMDQGKPYKEIYLMAKGRIEQLASALPKTKVIADKVSLHTSFPVNSRATEQQACC